MNDVSTEKMVLVIGHTHVRARHSFKTRINGRGVSHLRHTISFALQLLYRLSIAYYLSHCFALITSLRY